MDGDGKPELLLAQKNFLARRGAEAGGCGAKPPTQIVAFGVFSVKDQINGAGSVPRLVGAAALPNGTKCRSIPSFSLDAERKALTLCRTH